MTEPKNQRMTVLERFYIEHHWKELDIDTLSKHTKIQKRSIKRLVDKLKEKEDKSNMAKKTAPSVAAPPIAPAQDMIARKGIAVMTKSAAEIGDEIRKQVKKINSNCVVEIRESNV
jgi:Holliday junction resolvasome RuvABC DNA-binding subunit